MSDTANKAIGGLRSVADTLAPLTPFLLIFITYMHLAEDKRATARWESAAFERRVIQIVDTQLIIRNLATKEDIERLEAKLEPIWQWHTARLIKTGVIK